MILTDGPTLRVVLPDGMEAAQVLEPARTLEEVERRHILECSNKQDGASVVPAGRLAFSPSSPPRSSTA